MTMPEEMTEFGADAAPRLIAMPSDRRSLVAGALAAACGAAALAAGSRLTAAAPSGTAADTCAAQPATTGAVASPAAASPQVTIENFTFSPDVLTVPAGTEVTWTNKDDIPHTVTSDDKTTFASSLLDTDDTFSFRFDKPGTFSYFCSVHPTMTAKVVVQAGS